MGENANHKEIQTREKTDITPESFQVHIPFLLESFYTML
jgi:hypothetical protein